MKFLVVGLGNPGEEYEWTRHNAGRIIVSDAAKRFDASAWKADTSVNALLSQGKLGSASYILALPETFMNRSGNAVGKLSIGRSVPPGRIIVIHDDIDLPLGTLKLSFARGSGGHNGVESVRKALKTNEFIRIRVGVCPATPTGKLRKPSGDKKVHDFLLGEFKKPERAILATTGKRAIAALETMFESGKERAMNEFNTK